MKNRALQLMMLSLVVLMLLSASLVSAQEVVTIDFYFPTAVDGPIAAYMQKYADQFHEQNPNIIINPIYTGSYTQTRDTIITEVAAQDVIVDVAVMLATDIYSFVEDGSIMPAQTFIDQMEDGDAYVADFFPAMLANSTDVDGMIWSIPFQRSTPVLYYNVDMLKEAGYTEAPKNNEELIEIAQALTTDTRAGFLLPVAGVFPSWLFQSFAAAYGQPLVDADPTHIYLDTPESLAALEFVTKVGLPQDQGGFGVGPLGGSQWGDTPTAFTSGQAAMIYHTSGSLASILANATFEVGVSYLPSGPAGDEGTGYGSPMGGGNLYIFNDGSKSQEELDAAWAWVQFLSSPEIQADWGASNGYIAARQSAWELEPLKSLVVEHPQYLVARDQLAIAVKEFSTYRAIDTQNILNNALSKVISGEVPLSDAKTVLADAQTQIDQLLAEYR